MIKVAYFSFFDVKYLREVLERYSNQFNVLDYQFIKDNDDYAMIIRYTVKEQN